MSGLQLLVTGEQGQSETLNLDVRNFLLCVHLCRYSNGINSADLHLL